MDSRSLWKKRFENPFSNEEGSDSKKKKVEETSTTEKLSLNARLMKMQKHYISFKESSPMRFSQNLS